MGSGARFASIALIQEAQRHSCHLGDVFVDLIYFSLVNVTLVPDLRFAHWLTFSPVQIIVKAEEGGIDPQTFRFLPSSKRRSLHSDFIFQGQV